jgi:4-aminobutyrate aminotransferase-like enzyme
VKDEKAGDRTPAPETTLRLFEETKKRGLLIGRGGLYSNVLRVAPPLVVSRADVEEALRILDQSFEALGQ